MNDNIPGNAPRITPADVEASIASEWYINAATGVIADSFQPPVPIGHPLELLTFCVLVLKNGFTVTGESACVSPENFNAQIGREVARENAINKVWPLLGYELKERLHNAAVAQQKPAPGTAIEGYASMLPHQQRVCDEQAEVADKLNKLVVFTTTQLFESLPTDERERMVMQRQAMTAYNLVLCERIAAFKKGGA